MAIVCVFSEWSDVDWCQWLPTRSEDSGHFDKRRVCKHWCAMDGSLRCHLEKQKRFHCNHRSWNVAWHAHFDISSLATNKQERVNRQLWVTAVQLTRYRLRYDLWRYLFMTSMHNAYYVINSFLRAVCWIVKPISDGSAIEKQFSKVTVIVCCRLNQL